MQIVGDTHQKALRINLDPRWYGTVAEIGAGQEVARWFFRAGGAACTVAKTISAYDMAVSDAVYGKSGRYVSMQRLQAMLAERNITLTLDPSARELLSREGYDPNYGARPLKRAIQTLVQNPLAVKLLQGEILPGQRLRASAAGDNLVFSTEAAAALA